MLSNEFWSKLIQIFHLTRMTHTIYAVSNEVLTQRINKHIGRGEGGWLAQSLRLIILSKCYSEFEIRAYVNL